MNKVQAPSIFESFNARALRPSEVAKNFVPSEHYDKLIKKRHSILLGPRGSGKTTLLKMLQPGALGSWRHSDAEQYRERVDYTGVFVATDISWGAQIESLGDGKLDHETHRRLSIAAFTAHVFRSVIVAMMIRSNNKNSGHEKPHRNVEISPSEEVAIAEYIAEVWKLSPSIHSLLAIKQELRKRIVEIRTIADNEAYVGAKGRKERVSSYDYLGLHFREGVSAAIEIFNDILGAPDDRWALLFDELELAPVWVQQELVRSLRSTDERLIYKYALSPFNSKIELSNDVLSPSNLQDFEQIPLWFPTRSGGGVKFSEDLWYAMVEERGFGRIDPRTMLGKSYFETDKSEWVNVGTAYKVNSRLAHRLKSLTRSDGSYRRFLRSKNIDIDNLDSVSKEQREAVLRKIAPLVVVREYYRAYDGRNGRRGTRRSRKSSELYAGAESLFAITEGNPRWFIAIVGRILDKTPLDTKTISFNIQAAEILKASRLFAAMLRIVASPREKSVVSSRGLISIVGAVADYFHRKVVIDDFNPEPPGTFTVDSHVDESTHNALQQALNTGAIVLIPDDESGTMLPSLKGKRFRVSYLLAPIYGFPIRLGHPISLSTILKERGRMDSEQEPTNFSLFTE